MLLQMAQILEAIASSKTSATPESEKGEWARMSCSTGEFTVTVSKNQASILKQFNAIAKKKDIPVLGLVQLQCFNGILRLTISDLSTWLDVQFFTENQEIEFCHKVSSTVANLLAQGGSFRVKVELDRITVNEFPYDIELPEEMYPLPPWQGTDSCEEFLFSLDMSKEWKSVNNLIKLASKNCAAIEINAKDSISRTIGINPSSSRWLYTNGHFLIDRTIPILGSQLRDQVESFPVKLFQQFSGVRSLVSIYYLDAPSNDRGRGNYAFHPYLASGDGFTIYQRMITLRYPDIDALLQQKKRSPDYKCTVQVERQELLSVLRNFTARLKDKDTIHYLDTVGLCVEKESLTVALLQVSMRELKPKDPASAKYLLADNSTPEEIKQVEIIDPEGEQRDMILFLSLSYLIQIVESFTEQYISILLDNWQAKHHVEVRILDGLCSEKKGKQSNYGLLAPIRLGSSALEENRWN